MSSKFTGLSAETHSYNLTSVADSLKSNVNPQAMRTRNRMYQISATSGNQSSGGVLLFQIPPQTFSISKQTMVLRGRCVVTGAALGAGNLNNCVGWQGSGATGYVVAGNPVVNNNGINSAGVPLNGSAYAFMQRLTIYGSSSAIIEQRNLLNNEMDLNLMHNSSLGYVSTDGQISINLGAPFNYGNPGVNTTWNTINQTSAWIDFAIPLPSSLFQSTTQDVPMYLTSSPLIVQIDLASAARAIFGGSAATVTDYSIQQAFLCFQAVELPSEFIESERAASKHSPFIMNMTSSLTVAVPNSVLSSYSLGLNASSLRAVFVLPSNVISNSSGSQIQYLRPFADGAGAAGLLTVASNLQCSGTGVNAQVYCDGNLVNSEILNTVPMQFQSLKKALHHNVQSNILFTSIGATLSYVVNQFALGWDCTSSDEESSLFSGTPCTTLNIQLSGLANIDMSTVGGGNTNDKCLATVVAVYDVLAAFTDGHIEVKR